MKTFFLAIPIVLSVGAAAAAFSACSTPIANNPATVQLSSNIMALSPTDTTKTVDAALSCGCPCLLQDMKVTGDTDVIRFNLASHQTEESTHHITATAMPSLTKPGTYSCVFSFTMHDPMEMGGMHDYAASVTATFTR
jgi:hypothetical protein